MSLATMQLLLALISNNPATGKSLNQESKGLHVAAPWVSDFGVVVYKNAGTVRAPRRSDRFEANEMQVPVSLKGGF